MKRVEDYILHTPPMRLIEDLLEADSESVTTAVTIRPQTTFFDSELQGVPAWVGLEYMAQTAGVWVGMDDERHQRPIELGFLVSARQYAALRPLFPVGERLIIRIQRQFGEDAVAVFEGSIHSEAGDEFATAHFTAYRPDDVGAYLRGEL